MAFSRRRFRRFLLIAGAVSLLALIASRYILPRYLIHFVKERSAQIVRERFQADVQFGHFDMTLIFPELFITGDNVAISRKQEDILREYAKLEELHVLPAQRNFFDKLKDYVVGTQDAAKEKQDEAKGK